MLKTFLELNIRLLAILVVFGLLTGLLRKNTYKNLSYKKHGHFIINFLNLVGTPVHEFGHLIFALLFGYHITGVCFYRTLKKANLDNGTLGYVKMTHKKGTIFSSLQSDIGQFFVGIGPLISGPAVILLIYHFMPLPLKTLGSSFGKGTSEVMSALKALGPADYIFIIVFIYCVIGISFNMELSKYDLDMAWKGLLFLEIIFIFVTFVCSVLKIDISLGIISLSKYVIIISGVGIIGSLLTNLLSSIAAH